MIFIIQTGHPGNNEDPTRLGQDSDAGRQELPARVEGRDASTITGINGIGYTSCFVEPCPVISLYVSYVSGTCSMVHT